MLAKSKLFQLIKYLKPREGPARLECVFTGSLLTRLSDLNVFSFGFALLHILLRT